MTAAPLDGQFQPALASLLPWPDAGGVLNLRSLAVTDGVSPIAAIELLGYTGELRWGQDQDMARIVIPDRLPCRHAITFRIQFEP